MDTELSERSLVYMKTLEPWEASVSEVIVLKMGVWVDQVKSNGTLWSVWQKNKPKVITPPPLTDSKEMRDIRLAFNLDN